MTDEQPDLPALRASLQAAFPDRWDLLVRTVDDRYEPEDEPRASHYAWFSALVGAVLEPSVQAGDVATCNRVLAFALPLHGTPVGDAVQHRVLRYACRDDVRAKLRGLLDRDLHANLDALCLVTGNGA